MAADLKFLGDLHLGVFAGAQQSAGFFQIIILQSFGPAPDTAAPPRGLEPRIDALTQDGLEPTVVSPAAKLAVNR
jgi:hypothetical protein